MLLSPEKPLQESPGTKGGAGKQSCSTPSRKFAEVFWRVVSSPAFALIALLALQMKVMWAIWELKDISLGDTPSYFQLASEGLERHRVHFAWSPLYTFTGAALLHLYNHPLMFTVGMRLLLVITVTLTVFAIMRRLLPGKLAWFTTAWLAILPIYFDSLYEVHIFGCLPTLAAWLTLLTFPGRWGRGTALALFAVGAALVRNELSIPFVIFAAAVAMYEFRSRKQMSPAFWKGVVLPYAIPLLIAATTVAVVYERSTDHFPVLAKHFKVKHTLNVCQIYAANYQQRHPEWKKDPWTQYSDLMKSTFGKVQVTMGEAVVRNPRAMMEYFAWNASLIPSGLQVLLFNAAAGVHNPDYVPVTVDPPKALGLSALAILVLTCSVMKVFRQRQELLQWLRYRERYFCIIAMSASACCSLVVMLMQRPRPCYIFTLGISIMALLGFCLWRLFAGTRIEALTAKMSPLLMVALIAFTPAYYIANPQKRDVLAYFDFLTPFAPALKATQGTILLPSYAIDMDLFLIGGTACSFFQFWRPFSALQPPIEQSTNILPALDAEFANYILFSESNFDLPAASAFMRSTPANGWRLIGLQNVPGKRFALYERMQPLNLFVSSRKIKEQ
jgi:hypothetical protein